MKVILGAVVLAVIVALMAGASFYRAQEAVYRAQPGPGVRVGDPGHNLVGQGWTGDPTLQEIQKHVDQSSARAETKERG
jgi:hypothetical protein